MRIRRINLRAAEEVVYMGWWVAVRSRPLDRIVRRNSDARNRSQLVVFVERVSERDECRNEERRDAQLPNTGHSASSITAQLRRRGIVVDNRPAPRENP